MNTTWDGPGSHSGYKINPEFSQMPPAEVCALRVISSILNNINQDVNYFT